ncbi:hypothetical protein Glove_136g86 [Diversispora epigaea]|uniref:Uncharacterized protein n=1 Tax=Diversispora epigaea TaxID=1348612 RepID=A0A397IWN1_9GLOM|nr:hypothetical protein Glove_136g86 [Diversispora epigaea]
MSRMLAQTHLNVINVIYLKELESIINHLFGQQKEKNPLTAENYRSKDNYYTLNPEQDLRY